METDSGRPLLPGMAKLQNGAMIPTKELLTLIHDEVISDSIKTTNIGHHGIRDDSILEYLCYKLSEHKYKENALSNTYYIGTEIFFTIACRHPFIDGNKRTAYASSTLTIFANLAEMSTIGKELELSEEADTGETIEKIARWGEGSDSSSLEELAFNAGILGKRKREMEEEDVKRFINKFLRNTIRVHEEDSHG
jgi:prophage maintenance system killer protein